MTTANIEWTIPMVIMVTDLFFSPLIDAIKPTTMLHPGKITQRIYVNYGRAGAYCALCRLRLEDADAAVGGMSPVVMDPLLPTASR